MKKTLNWIPFPFVTVAVFLMMLPSSAKATWTIDGGVRINSYHSYFDFIHIAYANWFLIISAICAILGVFFILYNAFNHKKGKPVLISVLISVFSSAVSMLFFNTVTTVSIIITLLLVISMGFHYLRFRTVIAQKEN